VPNRRNETLVTAMAVRNTIVYILDTTSPRISAHEINEWIHKQLKVLDHSLTMLQIDGKKRQIFLKFIDDTYVQAILQNTNGRAEYKHVSGKILIVRLKVASTCCRRIRIANLPPAVPKEPSEWLSQNMGTLFRSIRILGRQHTVTQWQMGLRSSQ